MTDPPDAEDDLRIRLASACDIAAAATKAVRDAKLALAAAQEARRRALLVRDTLRKQLGQTVTTAGRYITGNVVKARSEAPPAVRYPKHPTLTGRLLGDPPPGRTKWS